MGQIIQDAQLSQREIGVEEHDGDVRFYTGSGNTAVSRMRNKNMQYNPYLWPNRRNFRIL